MRGAQPQLADEAGEVEDGFAPFEGAAKTDSWMMCLALAHLGQAIAWLWLMTMRS